MSTVEAPDTGHVPAGRSSGENGGAARGKPVGSLDGIPIYSSGEAPAHLRSKSQLTRLRLKTAADQVPGAYIYTRWYGDLVALWDPAQAARMRPLGSTVKRAMAARRTCPQCHRVGPYIVRYGRCGRCVLEARQAQERKQARTCGRCGRVRTRPYPGRRLCRTCRAAQAAERRERQARWLAAALLCGGGCSARVATRREVLEWRAANPLGYWRPRLCAACDAEQQQRRERQERERQDRERADREARVREVEALEAWAREVLADPATVVLDTETTGLDEGARIVEIAVLGTDGTPLLDSLVNPGVSIPAGATDVHGITNEMVSGAPAFAALLPQLTAVLDGRRVVIYNRSYDVGRLRHELDRHYGARRVRLTKGRRAHQDSAAWLAAMTFEDAMIPYSDWVGEENEYYGGYRWQRLNGGHRARGDCRAVLQRLGEMAGSADADPDDTAVMTAGGGDPWFR